MSRDAIPAAQYLRMSTDMQQYSLDNQAAAIAAYASASGYQIVQTYTDEGRSGLTLKERPALKRLLNDVLRSGCCFKAILVYDVSRWGRFQDTDEAAHYEFLCKSSGAPVHYCAEQFTNDPTLPNIIFKALKRTMAAEYSRQLSVNIQQTLRRIAERGYWAGSTPGYGLRRMLIRVDGTPKQVLELGEQKTLRAGFVTLVPGPKEELDVIKSIYEMLLKRHMNVSGIVRELAARGISRYGHPWTAYTVTELFTNPKYIGTYVWGRTEWNLRPKPMPVPPERWITKPDAFPAIVDARTFRRSQKLHNDRTECKTNGELLDAVRRLWKREGKLTANLIETSLLTATMSTYQRRFGGGIRHLYELVGYRVPTKRRNRERHRCRQRTFGLRKRLIQRLVRMFPKRVMPGTYDGYVNLPAAGFEVCVSLCQLRKFSGRPHWGIRMRRDQRDSITLLALLRPSNRTIQALYIFPRLTFVRRDRLYGDSALLGRGIRLHDLRSFYRAAVDANKRAKAPPVETLIGVPQIARHLRQSKQTIRRWIREGMPVNVDSQWCRAISEEIEQWARKHGGSYNHRRDKYGRFVN